jgi:transcriptional regulator GlxA family with amidase domain
MKAYDPDQVLVDSAKAMLDGCFAENISLTGIAKMLGVSRGHLARLFRKKYAKTPERYVAELRVKKAVELLRDTDGKVLEIAYAAGFKSPSSFYRCFREHTGHKPGEHRKNGGGTQCL